ncbi:RHS repeat-associated core domain-containing protein [Aeoliella straminimaris]|uniref:RHS repeat-associated core domain-containing protein n=1 Tax=Aeoliella straminimaris TaxID=2954799 RepID=UPI003CC563B9
MASPVLATSYLRDIDNEFLYTGRRLDPETGLQYSRYRYYHPQLGRFVNRDPIGYRGGMNLYAYVGGMPTRYTDPMGLVICKCMCKEEAQGLGEGGYNKPKPIFVTAPNRAACAASCTNLDYSSFIGIAVISRSCKNSPLTPDEGSVEALCAGNPKCESAFVDIMQIVGDTGQTGDPPWPYTGSCFEYLQAVKDKLPENTVLPGGCTVEYLIVLPEDYVLEDSWLYGPVRPTYYNRLGMITHGFIAHGVGRLCCPQKDGTKKCMYFDVGHGTMKGQYGGDDHWFSPNDPDWLFDIDQDGMNPYIGNQ